MALNPPIMHLLLCISFLLINGGSSALDLTSGIPFALPDKTTRKTGNLTVEKQIF